MPGAAEAQVIVRSKQKGSKIYAQLQDQLHKLRESAKGFGLAGGAAAVGIGAMVAKTIAANTELVRLGHTAGVGAKTMTSWSYAAKTVNVNSDKMASIFRDVSEKIGEFAATGGGEAQDVFQKLNLHVKDFVGLSPDQQILKVGQALDSVQSRSQKIFFLESLASDASELLPLLDDNAEGLKHLAGEAEKFGVSISEIDAAKMEMAQRSFERVQGLAQGLGNEIAVKVAPIIDVLAEKFVGAATQGDRMTKIIEKGFTGGAKVIGIFADGIHGVHIAFKAIEVVGHASAAIIAAGFGKIATLMSEGVRNAIIDGLVYPIEKALELLARITPIADEVLADVRRMTDSLKASAATGFKGFVDEQFAAFDASRAELHKMLMEDLPSTIINANIKKVLDQAQVQAEQKAAEIKANLAAQVEGTAPAAAAVDPKVAAELQKQKDVAAAKLEQVTTSLLEQQQVEALAYLNRRAIVDNAIQNDIVSQQQGNAIKYELQERFEKKITELTRKGWTERQKFAAKSNKDQAKDIFSTLESITSGVANSNKTMFRLNQAAAIGNAIINTYEGVSRTLAAYPWPIAPIFAALHLAAGLAQVSAIKSATFGGGTTPSLAGSTPTFNGQPVSTTASASAPSTSSAPAPATEIHIHVEGSIVGDEGVQQILAETMRNLLENDVILLPGDSRNAEEIRIGRIT